MLPGIGSGGGLSLIFGRDGGFYVLEIYQVNHNKLDCYIKYTQSFWGN
jgi:hypothetical protein